MGKKKSSRFFVGQLEQRAAIEPLNPRAARSKTKHGAGTYETIYDIPHNGTAGPCTPEHSPDWAWPQCEEGSIRWRVAKVCERDPKLKATKIARAVGVPYSKLQNRLKALGTSISGIRDEVRRWIMLSQIVYPWLRLDDIAQHLGYSQNVGLNRACAQRLIGEIPLSRLREQTTRATRENGLSLATFLITGFFFGHPEDPIQDFGFRYFDTEVSVPPKRHWSSRKHRLSLARNYFGQATWDLQLSDWQRDLLLHVLVTHQNGLLNPGRALHHLPKERIFKEYAAAIGETGAIRLEKWKMGTYGRRILEFLGDYLNTIAPLTYEQEEAATRLINDGFMDSIPDLEMGPRLWSETIGKLTRADGSRLLTQLQLEILQDRTKADQLRERRATELGPRKIVRLNQLRKCRNFLKQQGFPLSEAQLHELERSSPRVPRGRLNIYDPNGWRRDFGPRGGRAGRTVLEERQLAVIDADIEMREALTAAA